MIGVRFGALANAIAPAALAAIAMLFVVVAVDQALPPVSVHARLALLVASGGLVYASWLLIFARGTVRELIAVLRKQPLPAPEV